MTRRPPRWPAYLIGAVGLVVVVVLLIIGGATYDDHGNPLIDTTTASVLAAMFTAGGIAIQQVLGRIAHEVKPNHGSSMADAVHRIEASVDQMKHTQHVHGEKLARLELIPDDIRGIKKDVGRLAVDDQQMRRDMSDHILWAQGQEDRIDGLDARITHLQEGRDS